MDRLLAEAMQAGRLVTATGWSGNTGFMCESASVPLRRRLVPVHDPQRCYAGSHWAEADQNQALAAIGCAIADPTWLSAPAPAVLARTWAVRPGRTACRR